jgi:hypothetical protein
MVDGEGVELEHAAGDADGYRSVACGLFPFDAVEGSLVQITYF